jgi:small-conductance mechanosensitive channel
MTKIEALMLVSLGFLLALMLVFVFGRSVWTASNLYAKRKLEKDMPAAMLELQAERDELRAEYARMARKLEVGTETMAAQVVAQKAEVSRHRNRILNMAEQVGENDNALTQTAHENIDLTQQVSALSRELDEQQKIINLLRDELAQAKATRNAVGPIDLAHANENPEIPVVEVAATVEPQPVRGAALSRAIAANDQNGKVGRFNFDRRPLSPSMERTMNPSRQAELKDVIDEARRSLAAATDETGKPSMQTDPVLGFAQRIREIQKKSDAKLNKTLK